MGSLFWKAVNGDPYNVNLNQPKGRWDQLNDFISTMKAFEFNINRQIMWLHNMSGHL